MIVQVRDPEEVHARLRDEIVRANYIVPVPGLGVIQGSLRRGCLAFVDMEEPHFISLCQPLDQTNVLVMHAWGKAEFWASSVGKLSAELIARGFVTADFGASNPLSRWLVPIIGAVRDPEGTFRVPIDQARQRLLAPTPTPVEDARGL